MSRRVVWYKSIKHRKKMLPLSSGYEIEDYREMFLVSTKRHGITAQ
jgi:hypothetical protein